MNFYISFFYIAFFTSLTVSSQVEENSISKKKSIIDSININTGKAYSLAINFEYNKALILTLECLRKSDSIKNDSLLGKSYITYGVINTYLGKEKQAILNLRKAAAIFIKIKDYKNIGIAYNNIGWTYSINNKNLDSTIFYYKKALNACTKANDDKRRIAYILNNLGENYIELNEFDKAETVLKRSLKLYKNNAKTKNFSLSSTHTSFCKLYLKKKDLQKALQYGNLAENSALKYKNKETLLKIYKLKNKIFNTQGHYLKAHNYLKKYHENLKIVHENEKSRITQEMAAKFEVKEHKRFLEKVTLENNIKENKLQKSKQLITTIIILFIIMLLVVFLLHKNNKLKLKNNKLLEVKHKQLNDLQIKTELFFLKTQIQPHFFFNTLNNLYSLVIDKSDNAKDVVLKLYELMKYAMSGAKKVTVPIKQEIHNIKNYLELEGLRHKKITSSDIKITGEMDNIKVPPLLFITFIENCFKHNNVSDENFKLFISFTNIDSKHLFFNVRNTLTSRIENRKEKKTGIGIKNTTRRLKLIYNDKFDLKISTDSNIFSINLRIPVQN